MPPIDALFKTLAFKLAAVLFLAGIGLATSAYVKKGDGKFCEFGTFQLWIFVLDYHLEI